ncbi:hypothetical protein BDK51DRAFT_35188 [Blyttiomyces helicus]|uniref:Elongation factor 1-gamma n=1 Tax=Blyttiomyces helicus TaxID=388810 RepID=A0A4P9W3T7_9FUNG|nr:hypothetical protein BDK51DRAFT_35188 [Blyttiomyces helicus]|eukprot:RKO86991.1 hypothetical protein BDK51DRAFT_35188 [Blyttiomyces helicus]
MAPIGKIYSYPSNPRVYKAQIAAKYNGLEIEVVPTAVGTDTKTPEFLAKFPLGKVPTFETTDGFYLYESSAIAQYIASSKEGTTLLGKNKKEAALIQQFTAIADTEVAPAATNWLFGILGFYPYNEANAKKGIDSTRRLVDVLNKHLLKKTFLVGETITLADISLFTAFLPFFTNVFDPVFRAEFKNFTRWFITLSKQPNFSSVIGDVVLAEVVATPKKVEKKAEPKAEKKAEPKAEKKAEKKKKADDDEEDEPSYEDEKPKEKNPLDLLPPSSFNLDAWKRMYSNNDTRPTAVDWFWSNYDPAGFSIWKVSYKYQSELTLTFMSSNLIGGFFQRLERARKYAFGSLLVLGEDNKNEIVGYFVFRGTGVPFEVSDAADYESYDFKKVNTDDKAIREEFNAYIAWDEVIEGKKFSDGKIFK